MIDRSTTQIEREVEAQRYEVEETLDALRNKLSAGQILDTVARSFTTAGGQGGEFLNNLGRQVKANPLPIALTGVGLAWLLMGQNQKPRYTANVPAPRGLYPPQPTAYDRARYASDEAQHGAEYAVRQLRTGYYDVKAGARASAHHTYDQARYAADEAKHGGAYALGQLKAGAYAVQDGASSAAARAYDRAALAADEAKHGADHAVKQLKAGYYDVKAQARSTAHHTYDHARYAADEAKHGAEYAVGQLKAGAYKVQDGASNAAARVYDNARFAADEAKHGAKYVGDQIKAGAYAVQDTAYATADAMYDRARLAADEVAHGAAYVSDQLKAGAYAVSDAAYHAYESARDTAYDVADQADVYRRRAQRNVVDFVKEEPLIAGAIGIALGAALGAMLPSTRQEDELIGPYRDRARDEAIEYASTQADRAAHIAEESFKAAEAKAHEEGLVPEDGDKTVAEKAEDVVQAAKKKAKEEANS